MTIYSNIPSSVKTNAGRDLAVMQKMAVADELETVTKNSSSLLLEDNLVKLVKNHFN